MLRHPLNFPRQQITLRRFKAVEQMLAAAAKGNSIAVGAGVDALCAYFKHTRFTHDLVGFVDGHVIRRIRNGSALANVRSGEGRCQYRFIMTCVNEKNVNAGSSKTKEKDRFNRSAFPCAAFLLPSVWLCLRGAWLLRLWALLC